MKRILAVTFLFALLTAVASSQTRPVPVSPIGTTVQQLTGTGQGQNLSKVLGAPLPTPPPITTTMALTNGGDRLVNTQNTDGGWAWPLSGTSEQNTVGPITMGLAQAYRSTLSSSQLTALTSAGTFLLAKTNNFSPSDGYLAAELDAIFNVNTYTNHLKSNFYDKLAAGTYDKGGLGTNYSTASYVALIRSARASQGIANLAAWDIGMGLVGAAACGASTSEWIAGVKAEIDELDGSADYDVIGLAGAIYGLAYVNEDFDPTAGEHASASNLSDLVSILRSYQLASGGFTYSSQDMASGAEAIQETAYAILALAVFDYHGNRTVIESAADYMVSVQLTTGGWENYVGANDENNEVTGEALWGIFTAYSLLPTAGFLDCAANQFGTRFRSFGNTGGDEQYLGKDDLGVGANRVQQNLTWSAGTHHVLFSYDALNNVFTSQVTMDGTPPVPQTALTWTPTSPPTALDYIQFDVVQRDGGTTVNLKNIVLTIGATNYYIADLIGSGWKTWYLTGFYLAGGFSIEGDLELAGTFGSSQENSKAQITVCGAPNVALGACPILLNVANPAADVDVNYLGGASDDIFGYSVYFSYPDDVLDITSITPTDWLKGTGASYTSTTFQWKEFDLTGDNVVRVDASRLNQFLGGVGDPGTMFTVHFAPATGVDCGNGDLVIDPDPVNYPMKFRNAYNADITASIVAGDCHIELDVLAPVVQNTLIENLIVYPITGSHEYAKDTDNLKMTADVSDNCLTPTASMILADLSTLLSTGGTAVPADDYTSGVATWNLNNVTLTADGLKTVTITVTDLLNNTTTDSDDITVDNTDPMPATDLYAHPGHKKVNLEWTAGTDDNLYGYAVKTLQTNNVDGNEYPFYVPPMPTNPTAPVPADYPPVAAATDWVTNAFVSEPAATLTHAIVPRGVNYYTIYTFDWALNMAQTASSERATNYYLGDVGSGSGPLPGSGGFNGRIGGYDLTWFSTNYWWTDGTPDVRDEEEYHGDIGPTEASVRTYADDHRFGIPVPDGQIEFEDLMIFSMNYDNVAPKMPTPINVEIHKEFALRLVEERIGSDLTLFVRVENDGTPLKGASLLLQYDPTVLQVKGVDNGSLFGAADLQAFYAHRAGDGLVRFDAALLGNGRTVAYSGDLAVLHFTLMDRDANTDLLFGSVKMRDGGNQDIALRLKGAGSSMPEGYVLSQNYPNPFNPTTVIEYQIVEPGRVTIEVYNMLGARVATVVDGMHDAGSYQALLNATALPSGLYYYTMRAGSFTATRSMTLTK